MRQREGLLKGGHRGPALVPGNADRSLIFLASAHDPSTDVQMPYGGDRLPAEELAVLRQWIDAGAPWTDGGPVSPSPASWWAFERPSRPPVPDVEEREWIASPVDAFILAKLESMGIAHAPAADPRTLIRRVYFDLTGLPPPPEEVKAFVRDPSPEAYRKVVDELLQSPRYGERWGRHWLDVVRYADSSGFETDEYYPYAWRYRDYVIKSFNEDKPYDRFLQEQIAADELWPDDMDTEGGYSVAPEKLRHLEARVGTGVYTFGPEIGESKMDRRRLTHERLTDWTDLTGAAFMGLTLGCARCHDHKFDPITQRDYYRMQAIFAGSQAEEISLGTEMADFWRNYWYPKWIALDERRDAVKKFRAGVRERILGELKKSFAPEVVAAYEAKEPTTEQRELAAPLVEAIGELELDAELERRMSPEERAEYDRLTGSLIQAVLGVPEKELANNVDYEAVFDHPTARVLEHRQAELVPSVHVLERGELGRAREQVGPGVPSFLDDGSIDFESESAVPHVPRSRRQLALWLTRPDHPLTARVMVNRIWQWHFGEGLVRTANDFGRMGDEPSHPELLDWLASELVSSNWSIKSLHRLILLSNTYRMASRHHDERTAEIDPENRFLWRMHRERMQGEVVWDTIHAVAGTLSLEMGGRPMMPPLSQEELASLAEPEAWVAPATAPETRRRGVYILRRRGFEFPLFSKFDSADTSSSCPRRDETTVAPQALWILNNRIPYLQALQFAARLVREVGEDPSAWIERAWWLALSRGPTAQETREALRLIDSFQAEGEGETEEKLRRLPSPLAEIGRARAEALTQLCLALFNLNEFVYID